VSVVVGVDGSPGSVAALRVAIEEAKLRSTNVVAVTAWHPPTAGYETKWVAAQLDEATFREGATAMLEGTLAEVDTSGVEIRAFVAHGPAAEVLVEQARDADLLVVGSRGLGGFRGLLLGSVGQHCSQHATCPVLIVPHAREEQTSTV
jgi:nucleotide-binding universal stress UspA family protein